MTTIDFLKNLKSGKHIITPRLDQWLMKHPDLVLTDEDIEFISRVLSAKRGRRMGVFTGSAAGTCERAQMFGFLGVWKIPLTDPRLINLFHDGTWRHVRWQIMLQKAIPGFRAEMRVDARSFRGAFDGYHPWEKWGFELKGTSNFGRVIREGIFDPHQQQAARYLLASDEDEKYPTLGKMVFVYEDKQRNDWRELVVDRDVKVETYVERELKRLRTFSDAQELPDILPECMRGKGAIFRECPFHYCCLEIADWEEAQKKGSLADPWGRDRSNTKSDEVQSAVVSVGRRRRRKPPAAGRRNS